jgi:hypothetical protein
VAGKDEYQDMVPVVEVEMRGVSEEVRVFQTRTPLSQPWGRVQDCGKKLCDLGGDEEKRRLEVASSGCR